MRDLSAVMVTVDRSPAPNYLAETLENLKRSDLMTSERLNEPMFISCSDDGEWAAGVCGDLGLDNVGVGGFSERHCANLNVANALRVGAGDTEWVLFLEDDIDVCAQFFDSVGAWLDDHARVDRHIYSFGANYSQVDDVVAQGGTCWEYPIDSFYGTQAFAVRSEEALSLACYLERHCYDREDDGTAYDLLMAAWARELWPSVEHFLASAPALVQHIGMTSLIRPRKTIHTFPSWPGREWSYIKPEGGRQIYEPAGDQAIAT